MALNNRNLQYKNSNNLESKYKFNDQITSETLRVISELGEPMGVMERSDALIYAKDKGLDLIEVTSKTDPPVARVQSWSKFKFEQLKREKLAKKKNKSKELKEMWFAPLIGRNDMIHKVKRVREFLEEKHNVRLVVKMQGRVNYERGKEIMNDILKELENDIVIDSYPKYEAKQIWSIVRPNKVK